MPDIETVIGLEIHIQLDTASRLFSSEPVGRAGDDGADTSPREAGDKPVGPAGDAARPNAGSGPYAFGQPGTYPVLNDGAVAAALRLGLTLDCRINSESAFDRKHYFYPDLPRGYQITQHRRPICEGGVYEPADDPVRAAVRIRSLHLEEDAGRLIHAHDRTLVDYDRAGVPLLELVTEPDFRSASEAADFLRDLRDIVRTLGVSDGRLEDGSMRCDANISVRRPREALGARVEIKNLNSFRHVERALEFEERRQSQLVRQDASIREETRRYDADAGVTVPMRSKESAPDYRFIPEPDVPPVRIPQERIDAVSAALPERPDRRRRRLAAEHGLSRDWARLLASRPTVADRFDAACGLLALGVAPDHASSLTRRIAALLVEEVMTAGRQVPSAAALVELARMVEERRIDSGSAGPLLDAAAGTGRDPQDLEALAEETGLLVSLEAGDLDPFIEDAVREHPDEWRRYVGGKDGLLGFFVGRVLGSLDEPADPATVSERIAARRHAEMRSTDTADETGRTNPPGDDRADDAATRHS